MRQRVGRLQQDGKPSYVEVQKRAVRLSFEDPLEEQGIKDRRNVKAAGGSEHGGHNCRPRNGVEAQWRNMGTCLCLPGIRYDQAADVQGSWHPACLLSYAKGAQIPKNEFARRIPF